MFRPDALMGGSAWAALRLTKRSKVWQPQAVSVRTSQAVGHRRFVVRAMVARSLYKSIRPNCTTSGATLNLVNTVLMREELSRRFLQGEIVLLILNRFIPENEDQRIVEDSQ